MTASPLNSFYFNTGGYNLPYYFNQGDDIFTSFEAFITLALLIVKSPVGSDLMLESGIMSRASD